MQDHPFPRSLILSFTLLLPWNIHHGDKASAAPKERDERIERRVDELLSQMTLNEKLGQMTQADMGKASPEVAAELNLGSILSGADSKPSPATASAWADTYDGYQKTILSTKLGIPLLFGTDAVHGLNFFKNATVFPHNIGLGATRDPDLVQKIGVATALESAATGINWTFAPCVCVARDDRWGRTYEAFAEVPGITSSMTTIIDGLQGPKDSPNASILATAKHFIGDGGTERGIDRGDAPFSEDVLRRDHLPPFIASVNRNVATVMVSFSSWKGQRMHAHRYLITDILKGELKFDGFVISDWNAIENNDGRGGYSSEDVRSGINAGIDMFMVTERYRQFIDLARAEVDAGRVSLTRIDDAVRRILRKKMEFGLFEHPLTDRSLFDRIGHAEHRALARTAVQKSLVVLQNESNTLPIKPSVTKIFIAGKSADNIGYQSGGWTMSWQGGSGPTTAGTTIREGIESTVSPTSKVDFNQAGEGINSSHQLVIAVLGERPYAEFKGDRSDDLKLDAEDQELLRKIRASKVPSIIVLVSGRPLDISEYLSSSKAIVAAWLPGSEGQGVADILFGRVSPSGKLPVTWMKNAAQQPINAGDGQSPLYRIGHGLSYPALRD